MLEQIDGLFVVGEDPQAAVRAFAERSVGARRSCRRSSCSTVEALFWSSQSSTCVKLTGTAPKAERHRHRRKYATGALGPDKSFYFRGPRGVLNLRAQNLAMFLQIADGVDDETWQHHRDATRLLELGARHDQDSALATEIAGIELAADKHAAPEPPAGPRRDREGLHAAGVSSAQCLRVGRTIERTQPLNVLPFRRCASKSSLSFWYGVS